MAPAAVFASLVAVLAGWPSPLEGVAELLMEWTPLPVATFLLLHAGAYAGPAALLGAFAVALLCGGIAGAIGLLLPRGLGDVGALALLGALFLGPLAPPVMAATLVLLATFLAAWIGFGLSPGIRAGRREFLARSGAVLGGGAALVLLYYLRPLVWAVGARQLFRFQTPRGLVTRGVSGLVTSSERFYVNDKVLEPPDLGLGWHLHVDGAVGRSLHLSYADLLRRPAVRRYVTMECVDNPVGGPLIGNALWTGVSVAGLLREAGASGDVAVFTAVDEYAEALPLSLLERHGALIVYAMNGRTLSRDHGYPARLLVPGLYGFKSVKWLTGVQVTGNGFDDIWRRRGWASVPTVHTTTRIDVARRGTAGVVLAGIAFAGNRGIRAVEVRVNGGKWHRAQLGPVLGRAAWVQWFAVVDASAGARVEARAVDGLGRVQPERRHGSYPNGASGWATVTI